MDEKSASPRGPAPRSIPFIVGVPALLLYLATVCRWLSPLNLEIVGQTAGWLWQLPYQSPLLFLVCLPLRVLPDSLYPLGANVLAAVFGALSVGLLARSVMLLPYDRTREGRVRGHAEEALLHIRFAWVPPVFAAAIVGLQLSFWENATSQTGEMLDLLMFAYCIRCLLEYRLEGTERWLWKMAFAYGLGVTNNWAMIGFFPFFLVAVIWIRGFSFFNFGFLVRVGAFGCAGLLLYALMPAWVASTKRVDATFLQSLYSVLASQKTLLLAMPRGRPLMLALVCILPFVAMGIRWAGIKGSSVERGIASGTIYLLKFAWMVMGVVMAFDIPMSPRELVQNVVGLPMLTFYYLAALMAGYFLGLFLLVFGTKPDRLHGPRSSMPPAIPVALHWVLLVAALGAPLALGARNFNKARDTGLISDLATELTRPLPAEPCILVSDNMSYLWLAEAQRRRTPGAPQHLLIHTSDAKRNDYQRYLDRQYGAAWPGLKKFTAAESGILLEFLNLVVENGRNGRAFYMHHSQGLFFEMIQLRPRGLVNEIHGYSEKELRPAPMTAEEAKRHLELWRQVEGSMARHIGQPQMTAAARILSRAANHSGVELQRSGRFDEAKQAFEFALKINPKNPLVLANLQANEALRAKKPLSTEPARAIAEFLQPQVMSRLMNTYGPVDEPAALRVFGRICLESPEELNRQAVNAFERLRELLPDDFNAVALLGASYLAYGMPEQTLKLATESRGRHARKPLAPAEFAELIRMEASSKLRLGESTNALQIVNEAYVAQPENVGILDTLSSLLLAGRQFDEAGRVIAHWNRLKPEDIAGQLRRVQLQMFLNQWQPSIDGLSAVLKKDPVNRTALMNRAICYLQLKRFDDARRDYNRIAEEYPNIPQVQYGLGEIAMQKKEVATALEHFERYKRLAPPGTTEYTNVLERIATLKAGTR